MSKIILNYNSCTLEETDSTILQALDRELSFDVQGAQYTPSYRGYFNKDGEYIKWDGKYHFLTNGLTFPRGLLGRVENFYKSQIEVVDVRKKTSSASIDILPILKTMGKSPFYYQLNALEAAKSNDCGILRLSTGSGKSILSTLIIAEFGKTSILFVVGKDLLYQGYALYCSIFGEENVGIIGDGQCKIRDINIASVWTVAQALGEKKSKISEEDLGGESKVDPQKYKDIRELLKISKVNIFDECHQCACQSITDIANTINPEHIYGMSASPYRSDGSDMMIEAILGKNIIDVSASELIAGGYLVKPTIKFYEVPKLNYEVPKQYQTIYKHYISENPVRNAYCVKAAIRLVEQGYSTLVLYNSISHGELLYKEISKAIPCALVSGKDDMNIRNEAKQKIESKEINCVLASRIFDQGIDLPCLSALVMAASGKSTVRAIQRVGRIIRNYKTDTFTKTTAAVVDFIDNAAYLKDHSKARYKMYSAESGFDVVWKK